VQPLAQIELARNYWGGTTPFKENRVIGQMWYRLAEEAGYEVSNGHSREDLLTSAQIAEAERLVAEWEPNPGECKVYAEQADR